MLFFVGLLFIFSSVHAETPYVCNGTSSIAAPANLTQVLNYPNNWNVSLPDPYYAANQECRWNVEVPNGYYAYLMVRASTDSNSSLRIIYSNGIVENVPHSSVGQPFFMLAPKFSIHLVANVNGTLGFSISYAPIPSFNPAVQTLSSNNGPVVLDFNISTVITTTNQVSLITSDARVPDFTPFMRSIVLFDGQNMNSSFIGNMYQVLNSENQIVSSGKSLTIVNLLGVPLGNTVVVQDYSNVQEFSQYKFASCISSPCSVGMNAVRGISAVVSVSKTPIYLTDISISSTSNLKVYYGTIDSSTLVHTYDSKSRSSSFPQKLNHYITIFVLDTQTGLLQLSFASFLLTWPTSVDGRQGFISSKSLYELSTNQDVIETFSGVDNYNYTTQIKRHGLVGKATLQITTYDASDNAIDDHIYTTDKLPPTIQDVHPGKSLSVIYRNNGEKTNGILIDFSIAKIGNSASNRLFWFTSIFSFIYCFFSF